MYAKRSTESRPKDAYTIVMNKVSAVPGGYFDYAAATPLDPTVLKAMDPYFSAVFYNPSADYEPGRQVKTHLDGARADIAEVLGAKPVEIVFTAGGTEANNLAIHGVMQLYPQANVVYSGIEHESVRAPCKTYNNREIPVDERGVIRLESLDELIDDQTALVSVMLANNEIGTIQPIKKLAEYVTSKRRERLKSVNKLPLYLHIDAAQAGNYLDMHVHRLGVDLMTINGGKIYGPKQSGALFVRSGVILKPTTQGGGQERGLRSGTENVAGAIGLAAALSASQKMRADEHKRLSALQSYFFGQIGAKIPAATINGPHKNRLPNNVHITIPGQDNERLLILLDEKEIYAAAGSACSAAKEEPSHVLAAIGLNDDDTRASLRFTMGRRTTQADVDHAIATLASILA